MPWFIINTINTKESNINSKNIHTNMTLSTRKCTLDMMTIVVTPFLRWGGMMEPRVVFVLPFCLRTTRNSAQIHDGQDLHYRQERPYQRDELLRITVCDI